MADWKAGPFFHPGFESKALVGKGILLYRLGIARPSADVDRQLKNIYYYIILYKPCSTGTVGN